MKNLQEGNRLLKLWILGHVIKTDMALFLQVTHLQSNSGQKTEVVSCSLEQIPQLLLQQILHISCGP